MTLLDSLLDAIIRLQGDSLVLHVGEKPYVVTTSAAMGEFRGPLAWGQVELSSRVLTSDAVLGMLGQIVPADLRQSLDELGAIEHELTPPVGSTDRFTLIAARGGDDVFLELRRQPKVEEPVETETIEPPAAVEETPVAQPPAVAAAETIATPVAEAAEEDVPLEIVPDLEQESLTDADVNALLADSAAALLEAPPPSFVEERAAADTPLVVDETPEPEIAAVAEEPGAVYVVEEPVREPEPVVSPEPLTGAARDEPLVTASEPPPEVVAQPEQDPVAETIPEPAAAEIEPQPEVVGAAAETPIHDVAPQPVVEEIEPQPEPVVASAEKPVHDVGPEPVVAEIEPQPELVVASTQKPIHDVMPVPVEVEPQPIAVEEPVLHADVETTAVEPIVEHEPQPVAAHAWKPEAEAAMASPTRIEESSEREARAVVVPLARPIVRTDAAAAAASSTGLSVEELLRLAAARGASTVYVVAQAQPMLRSNGGITPLDIGSGTPLTESDVNRVILDLAPPAGRDAWQRGTPAEWTCDVADVGPVRCLTFRDHRGPGLIFRMTPLRATLADQLGLTPDVRALCTQSDGLVIVSGPRASGKSTLLSAFIDLINRTSSDHVITIESQVGFAHENRRSFISQREVRGDGAAVVAAVRSALREDPDVLLIEDLRSAEIASVALEAAEAGRLVFASVPAASTVAAVNRLLEMFPADHRSQAQTTLAARLRGVVAQVLLRRAQGGRIAAREILLNTPAVSALLEEGRTAQLPRAMESGRGHGMMPLNDALASFVREGTVHVAEAYLKAFDKEGLVAALRREGADTSFAERLA